ncbi:hypothetical protein LguiA_008393 [Lonicera macranthoides]
MFKCNKSSFEKILLRGEACMALTKNLKTWMTFKLNIDFKLHLTKFVSHFV